MILHAYSWSDLPFELGNLFVPGIKFKFDQTSSHIKGVEFESLTSGDQQGTSISLAWKVYTTADVGRFKVTYYS
jgi:hypothetical protein